MDFGANKTPVEIIEEGAYGGTYFRYIYSGINGKWYRKFILVLMGSGTESHGKNSISWKISIRNVIVQIIMMLVVV